MPYVRCGHSGLLLPKLAYGLWKDFREDADARARALHAFDNGITHFDLADNYGDTPGDAEQAFGKLLKTDLKAHRDELIVSSKAGYLMWSGPYGDWGSRKHLLAGIDQSLRRLGLAYVDIFYTHRPDVETPMEETAEALAHIVRSGKALYVGLSNYNPEQTALMCDLLRARNTPCLLHQGRLNLLEPRDAGVLPIAQAKGIGFAAYSPLAQGLLCDRQQQALPDDARANRAHESTLREKRARALPLLHALGQWAHAHAMSLESLALVWLWSQSGMTTVIGSPRTHAQLDGLIQATQLPLLSSSQLREIDALLLGGGRQPDRTVIA